MTLQQAVNVLDLHQQWRKGAEIPMQDPAEVGMALDAIIPIVRDFEQHIEQAYQSGLNDGLGDANGWMPDYRNAADYFTKTFPQCNP